MAWTAPMTAVANSIFSAAQFNTYVRNNLNETMPAKATAGGQYFVSNGANSLIPRSPVSNTITTGDQMISSSSYQNISGASVTVTTGTEALVHIASYLIVDTAERAGHVSYKVTGASNLIPEVHHPNRLVWDGVSAGQGTRCGGWGRLTTLRAGSNTFTMQGRISSSGVTMTVRYCHIIVIPLS